jgi:hypothetical protein
MAFWCYRWIMQAGAAAASAGSDHATLKDLPQVDQKLDCNYILESVVITCNGST